MAKKFSQLLAQLPPERLARIEEETQAMLQKMALADLRKARRMSQAELARNMGIKQPSVADMEKRTDMYISTLRSLIEGMGGKLEIVASFPDAEVRIKNFSEI